jgi:hypothetical protein
VHKPTIHVVTEYNRKVHIETYWKDCFRDEDFSEYDVNIIDGSHISHDSFLWADTYYKNTQLNSIMNMILRGEIKNGDVFVFVNAWNFLAVPLSYFKDEYGMDIKMVGFWGNALFNQESPMWQRFKRKYKTWGREFEHSLFQSYDMNCFLCEEHSTMFFNKYPRLRHKKNWSITGFPFEYISKGVIKKQKEDIVLFPYEINSDLQVKVFQGMSVELPQYQFIYAQEHHNNRMLYLDLLRKSKTLYCGREAEANPVVIWEAMENGVVPMVPGKLMYYYVFPERYHYPKELSSAKNNKFLYLLRNRFQMVDYVRGRMEGYEEVLEQLKEDSKDIRERFYSNKRFLQTLKEL